MTYPFTFSAPKELAQTINPWNFWFKQSDNMNGLVNIVTYKSSNPTTEHRITHEVAGYGAQLDVIEELLKTLCNTVLVNTKLSQEQKKTVDDFNHMLSDIQKKKQQIAEEALSTGGINTFLANLKHLKEADKAHYDEVINRIKGEI